MIGPFTSGKEITLAHTWSEKKDYVVKARAQDINGHWSFWGTFRIELQKGVKLNKSKDL